MPDVVKLPWSPYTSKRGRCVGENPTISAPLAGRFFQPGTWRGKRRTCATCAVQRAIETDMAIDRELWNERIPPKALEALPPYWSGLSRNTDTLPGKLVAG